MDDKLIAIVDDDPEIVKLIGDSLKSDGFRVKGFSCAEDLYDFLEKEKPDLILLDIILPGVSGIEVCKNLKKKKRFSSIPIIMISGKSGEADRISGLDTGSDDYIVKPCSINETKARVRAVLRRYAPGAEDKKICIGGLVEIDLQKFEVTVEGKKAPLTPVEFRILECLSSRKSHVFSRRRILEFLWGEEKVVIDRTIDVHIRHLRNKLGKAAKFIKNVRGIGYKIEEDA